MLKTKINGRRGGGGGGVPVLFVIWWTQVKCKIMPNLTFRCLDEEVPVKILRLLGESANNNVLIKKELKHWKVAKCHYAGWSMCTAVVHWKVLVNTCWFPRTRLKWQQLSVQITSQTRPTDHWGSTEKSTNLKNKIDWWRPVMYWRYMWCF